MLSLATTLQSPARFFCLITAAALLAFACPAVVQAGTQVDGDYTIELSRDTVYQGEDVTVTFTHSGGETINSIQLYTLDGNVIYAKGNSITARRSELTGGMTPSRKDIGLVAKLRVGSGGIPASASFKIRVEDTARPGNTGQPAVTYNPTATIEGVLQLGNVQDLNYRFTAGRPMPIAVR